MCGIAGIINLNGQPVEESVLKAMTDAMAHRGPDDSGIHIDGSVGLGHRRLSIIDLGNGHQPLANEDNTIWTVYNGEIYNYPELRPLLESKGHVFRTNCDTEAIVHLYEEYGSSFIEQLNGMFAIALYDLKQKKLLLYRDRLGQKPLAYFRTANTFAFASELGGLKQHPDMPRELDLQAVHHFLSLQYIPTPGTVYQQVLRLPPASILELDLSQPNQAIEPRRYWQVDYGKKTAMTYPEASKHLHSLLRDAVEKRLMSDVPFGAFLSGGVDSSIITGLMSEICDQPVKTFTIGFQESLYDERQYADAAVAHLNSRNRQLIEHHEKVVKPDDFDVVKKLVTHYGEPYSDASMLPTYLLSAFTRENVTVSLSGDGADELFAGYNRYLVMRYAQYADYLPLPLRKAVAGVISGILPPKTEERSRIGKLQRLLKIGSTAKDERYLSIINRFAEDDKTAVHGDRFAGMGLTPTEHFMSHIEQLSSAKDDVERVMELDLHSYLDCDILTKVDIASMATSLEVRSPFMDHRVVEFAASLPLDFKQSGTSRKHILRDTFSSFLTEDLSNRGKMGFGVPLAKWFREQWDDPLCQNLLDGRAARDGYLNRDRLETMIAQHQAMQADHSYSLWAMLIFELFLQGE